ncbi:MAG: helicase-related protein [Methanomassiliicoccales archaeon]
MFVEHPLIKPQALEERDYQRALSDIASKASTLIVLPTGMGKTVIALRVMAEVLRKGAKVLFLAPTKPLVEQHAAFLQQFLMGKKVGVMTGEFPPEEREAIWIENDVIVSTPQVVANDLHCERVNFSKFKLLIFDEAHRAVGNYAYVQVAREYREQGGELILGMTASPGSKRARIEEVCANLGIERIEQRSESDPDVAKYIHEIQMDAIEMELPIELKRLVLILRSLLAKYVEELMRLKAIEPGRPINRKHLLELGNALQARYKAGERHRNLFRAMSLQAMAVKVDHALEMAETQGTSALLDYLERLKEEAESEEGTRAAREIINAPEYQKAWNLAKATKVEHPKLGRLMTIVARQIGERPDARIIVFTHFRTTCDLVASKLAEVEGARVAKLVGQADRCGDRGLRQREQVDVLERFREGHFNVLVATSVGEEGLDVANTDLVIFYEPVPSEIRSIQRRGRTGRKRAGRIVVLVTKRTRDEAYFYASMNKERAMRKGLSRLQRELEPKPEEDRKEEMKQDKKQPEALEGRKTRKGQREILDFA